MMHGFQCSMREWVCEDRNDSSSYCADNHLAFLYSFHLGFFSLLLLATMEDKRETKRSRSPSKGGSSSSSSGLTPPPAPSGSPPPPRSSTEVSSHCPYPPVLEQGGPSEKISVVDLSSSDEEDLIPDITWDAEFTKKSFGDLNHELLVPLVDGKIPILNDSDQEKEKVREEGTTDVKIMPSSIVKSHPNRLHHGH
jgi:hypothetical protein